MRQTKLREIVVIVSTVLITAFAVTAMMGTSCNVPDEPATANDWYRKGKSYADDEMYGKAIECLTKAIEIDPKLAKAYDYRGYCYYSMIQYEEAIADFKMALKLGNERSEETYYYMGWTHYDMGNYDEAVKCFTKTIEMSPNNARLYYDRGCAYKISGHLDEAEYDFRKACSLGKSSGCEVVEDIVKDRIEREKKEKKDNFHE
jgi:tetratricopeptide (TPR) repeat protein